MAILFDHAMLGCDNLNHQHYYLTINTPNKQLRLSITLVKTSLREALPHLPDHPRSVRGNECAANIVYRHLYVIREGRLH